MKTKITGLYYIYERDNPRNIIAKYLSGKDRDCIIEKLHKQNPRVRLEYGIDEITKNVFIDIKNEYKGYYEIK